MPRGTINGKALPGFVERRTGFQRFFFLYFWASSTKSGRVFYFLVA